MKLLLDECLPRRLKRELLGHDVVTVPEMGWAGIKNGPLLAIASYCAYGGCRGKVRRAFALILYFDIRPCLSAAAGEESR